MYDVIIERCKCEFKQHASHRGVKMRLVAAHLEVTVGDLYTVLLWPIDV